METNENKVLEESLQEQPTKQNKVKDTIIEYAKVIIGTLIVTYIALFFFQFSRVQGTSMLPTYHEGNLVIIDKFFYKKSEPKVNDIVIVDYIDMYETETFIIKRVVAVAGDKIEIKKNQLYRNDSLIDENYIYERMDTDDFSYTVPKGKVFVLGDNRNVSKDSRTIGYVDFEKNVVGKVVFDLF